jgi:hypothetical protein
MKMNVQNRNQFDTVRTLKWRIDPDETTTNKPLCIECGRPRSVRSVALSENLNAPNVSTVFKHRFIKIQFPKDEPKVDIRITVIKNVRSVRVGGLD